jgi:hypothetical protein
MKARIVGIVFSHPCRDRTASWMGHPQLLETWGWLDSQVSEARPFGFARGRLWGTQICGLERAPS